MAAVLDTVILGLVERITSIVLKTYEVQHLLLTVAATDFVRSDFHLNSVCSDGLQGVTFECVLTLEAEFSGGTRLPDFYEIAVTGEAVFESPAWDVQQIVRVIAPSQQCLW